MRDYGITDPEFTAICERFLAETGEEAARELPPRTGALAVLAALIGCGGSEMFRRVLPRALDGDLTPEEARETVYQAANYLGLGRMLPFLDALDGVLEERGVSLPLPAMGTTDESDRLERGAAAQAEIFGEHMLEAWKAGFINRALAANCFGDLLHPRRARPARPRAHHLLLPRRAGRLRAAAHRPRPRKHEHGQQPRDAARRVRKVPALYRLPPHAERCDLRQ